MYEQSGFDAETKAYLKRILHSIFITLVWMMTNAVIGLYFKLAIIEDSINLLNILFYLWFTGSFIVYLWLLRKLWKGHM
jgi:hypothetical protein